MAPTLQANITPPIYMQIVVLQDVVVMGVFEVGMMVVIMWDLL